MDIWSSYWKGPRLTCTLAGHGIGYPESLTAVWREFFATLEDGVRLLDIGTGNGALAIIANDTARLLGRQFEIHACDRSDIDPPAFLRGTGLNIGGIAFHANTPAERTQFPNAYFDAVTGQFALEYTDMAETVVEMARVLKPGGHARFILHMRGGMIYEQTQRQIRDIRFIQNELRLLEKARTMMETTYAREGDPDPDEASKRRAREAQTAFFQAANAAHDAIPRIAYKELYSDTLKVIAYHWNNRRRLTLERFMTRMEQLNTEISMARERHLAMCESALDPTAMKALANRFCDGGFAPPVVTRVRLGASDDRDFGWDLSTRLPRNGNGR